MKEKTYKNPKGAGTEPKPDKKVQYGGGRINAHLVKRWKEQTGNKVFHLEKALSNYLDSLPFENPSNLIEERNSSLLS